MRRLWVVIAIAFVVGIVADVLVGEDVPGFIAVFSFVGCIVIIVASKWLGKALLQRREDYYEGADA
jgi:cell shape-determining protein MreD